MTRAQLGWVATVLLLGLTMVTGHIAETGGSAGGLAALAMIKVAVIGGVFLELDRAWPPWAFGLLALCAGISGGAVLLLGG